MQLLQKMTHRSATRQLQLPHVPRPSKSREMTLSRRPHWPTILLWTSTDFWAFQLQIEMHSKPEQCCATWLKCKKNLSLFRKYNIQSTMGKLQTSTTGGIRNVKLQYFNHRGTRGTCGIRIVFFTNQDHRRLKKCICPTKFILKNTKTLPPYWYWTHLYGGLTYKNLKI